MFDGGELRPEAVQQARTHMLLRAFPDELPVRNREWLLTHDPATRKELAEIDFNYVRNAAVAAGGAAVDHAGGDRVGNVAAQAMLDPNDARRPPLVLQQEPLLPGGGGGCFCCCMITVSLGCYTTVWLASTLNRQPTGRARWVGRQQQQSGTGIVSTLRSVGPIAAFAVLGVSLLAAALVNRRQAARLVTGAANRPTGKIRLPPPPPPPPR